MSWTTPKTWTTGELVTAEMMNTHVRDNMLETAPAKVTTAGDLVYASGQNALTRLGIGSSGKVLGVSGGAPAWLDLLSGYVRKTADESVSASITPQDDNHLFFSIGANEVWAVHMRLACYAQSDSGIRYCFSVPSGCTGWMGGLLAGYYTSYYASFGVDVTAETLGGAVLLDDSFYLILDAVFINGATAGTIQFKWAQQNSQTNPTTIKAQSSMEKFKLV